ITERIQEQLFPNWKIDVAAVGDKAKAMGADTLLSARKIRQHIADRGEIGSAFDDITYEKGSAVIRMFENYVGRDAFRKGVQNYMRKHAAGSAHARDVLSSIAEEHR